MMLSSSNALKRACSRFCSKPSLGMMTVVAEMMSRICSIAKTMALSLTRILPVSDVSKFGSSKRMSLNGMPSLSFCTSRRQSEVRSEGAEQEEIQIVVR